MQELVKYMLKIYIRQLSAIHSFKKLKKNQYSYLIIRHYIDQDLLPQNKIIHSFWVILGTIVSSIITIIHRLLNRITCLIMENNYIKSILPIQFQLGRPKCKNQVINMQTWLETKEITNLCQVYTKIGTVLILLDRKKL